MATKKLQFPMSQLDKYNGMGLKLYWTPGAAAPYWAAYPSFMYDECVAIPADFLASAGYDSFNEDHDYSGADDLLEYEVEVPSYLKKRYDELTDHGKHDLPW